AVCFFLFQAEDGIRDFHVTGVQTCALPIFALLRLALIPATSGHDFLPLAAARPFLAEIKKVVAWLPSTACRPLRGAGRSPPVCKIGRASCRGRGESSELAGTRNEQQGTWA